MAARPAATAQPLRGRDAEMAAIDAALGGARDGRGSVLLVEGGPGLGKSRLLEEAVRLAGRAGVRAAVGRADVDDTVVPMGPLMSACFGGSSRSTRWSPSRKNSQPTTPSRSTGNSAIAGTFSPAARKPSFSPIALPYGMQAYYSRFATFAPEIAMLFWRGRGK